MNNRYLLEADKIYKEYRLGSNALAVLQDVTLGIAKGEIIGIIGPSGAGKSTLINLLGGLDKPTHGSVALEGKDIATISERERAHIRNERFGFVFQFYHLLAELNTLENVMLPLMIKNRMPKKIMKEKASAILERCGLSQRLRHRPSELSGGEQQRVAIARALVNSPEILFCDEPTGNLDTERGMQIKELLWQSNRESKTTLIIVTHSQELVEGATRIIHLRDGRILP